MSELNPDKIYEWFIINAEIKKRHNGEYLVLKLGCVETDDNATIDVLLPREKNTESLVYKMMRATGYNKEEKSINPLKHFVRGMHVFAKPVKEYRGSDSSKFNWSIQLDTLSSKSKKTVDTPKELIDRIMLIASRAPSFEESLRRMANSDPLLAFEYGRLVALGVITKDGKPGPAA